MSQSRKNPKRRVLPAKSRKQPGETLPQWGERMKESGRALPLILLAQLIMSSQRDVYQGFRELLSGKLQLDQFRISSEIRREYYLNRSVMWVELLEICTRMISGLATGDSLTPPPEVERFQKLWDKATPDSRRRLVEILIRVGSDPQTIAICSEMLEMVRDEVYPYHLELLKQDYLQGVSEDLI
ncbi:MAG: hypothetical protein KDA68_23700 [Planctomycetaceae bacterium]|nr:hypothetical protein [Planctomycetaceae bacterium]